jgi:antitoxin CptB
MADGGPLDAEGRRLLWRCRRGMKELDVLLERFARRHLALAGRSERELFTRFLELPDPVLAGYLLGEVAPREPEVARLVRSITEQAPPADSC